jgi:hypothetical protein
MGEKGKQRVDLCYCSTAVAAAAAAQHLCSRLSCCSGSPYSCSPALIHACPAVRVLVLPFVWAVPVCAHQPLFVLTTTHSRSLLLAGPHAYCCLFVLISIRLPVLVLVWLSLVLIGAHFGFICALFMLIQLSFALVWAPQPLVCVCIKYMVSTYILNRLTFIPCIINLCKTID